MAEPVNIEEIIELVRKQKSERKDIINALANSFGGNWQTKAYYIFVDNKKANQTGAQWQFDESVTLEHETLGTIVIDYLKDKRIGGIEYIKNLD